MGRSDGSAIGSIVNQTRIICRVVQSHLCVVLSTVALVSAAEWTQCGVGVKIDMAVLRSTEQAGKILKLNSELLAKLSNIVFCIADAPASLLNCVSGLGLVCLVVALVGIKLKWFKHRLTFNEPNNDAEVAAPSQGFYSTISGEGGGVPRSSSSSSEPQIVSAIFRSFDEFVDISSTPVLPRKWR